ncbi:sugar phosphate isomerase/epimerase family protein [Paenibacillus thalictri]|uniref:Sugar phosphate isomerase/epimerase n=1 Tax=Paenibacillus thalictri TaxID=2527873 RepID=A0A4V6MSE5_9BACL|nr:sugar phosphate isomerase/epimerase family protein [Paenibacillus thalictri]TBL73894.1 sugar phosphate isomerase/epimerase [Paenibacillus thalictri]
MEIGIFSKTFIRPTLGEVLDAVQASGLRHIQFNLACAGLPSMPERLDPATTESIGKQMQKRRLQMTAVSGTFNMIHPNAAVRAAGMRSLGLLAQACGEMGTSIITLCTGTRDPSDMWRFHPDNSSPSAWKDLVASVRQAVGIAEEYGVTVAFEPEAANVVDTAVKARRLLDEIDSPRLKVVMDAANLIPSGQLDRAADILQEAFELLGQDIALAHAKDVLTDQPLRFGAAGRGKLDFALYAGLLRKSGYTGPLIMHGLAEEEIAASRVFLQRIVIS